MNITIIGTGRMGRGLSTRFLQGGNKVELAGHSPGKAETLVEELKASAMGGGSISVAKENTLTGEIVFLAVPYSAVAELVEHYYDQLDGKILVDSTNPVNYQTMESIVMNGSGAEEIARQAPKTTRVIKAFNVLFAKNLVTGEVQGIPLDVLIAGDDDDAKLQLKQAVAAVGLRGLDVGPLARARQLEAMGLLLIAMQSPLKTNYTSAFQVMW